MNTQTPSNIRHGQRWDIAYDWRRSSSSCLKIGSTIESILRSELRSASRATAAWGA